MNYGTQAPFTVSLLESFGPLNLTPSDWQQLCRAALSGGDFLVWREEFQEKCFQTAQLNTQARQPQRNLKMLTGTGQYAALAQQMQYDVEVYSQIVTAATAAWKALPNKKGGDQLSKILQGPSEPFHDFVNRLLQLAECLFGGIGPTTPIVKQLAFENTNKYCKDALRSHKHKNLNNYIKICRKINSNFIQGQVLAAALRESETRRAPRGPPKSKHCFECGKFGHFRKECPKNKQGPQQGGLQRPGLCPRCQHGYHWANDCHSKTGAQGNPLPVQQPAQQSGNWIRAQPQGPRTSVWGNDSLCRQRSDSLCPSEQPLHLTDLLRATPGSAGLDLCPSI